MKEKKDSKGFSNESFREKILAQLEENRKKASQFDDDLFEDSSIKEDVLSTKADDSFSKSEEKTTELKEAPVASINDSYVQSRISEHEAFNKSEKLENAFEPDHATEQVTIGEIEPELEKVVVEELADLKEKTSFKDVSKVMASEVEADDTDESNQASQAQIKKEEDSHMENKSSDMKEPSNREDSRNYENAYFEPLDRSSERTEYTRANRKKQKSIARKIITAISLILLILLAVAGFMGYRYIESSLGPMDKNNESYVTVEVPNGSSNKQIGSILEKNGIIKSATAFQYYTKFKSQSSFKSGYYNFSPSMNLEAITEKLSEGGTEQPQVPSLGKVTIPEGYTLEQIAEAITVNAGSKDKDASPFSKDDFLKVVSDDAFINRMKEKYPQLTETMGQKGEVKYQLEGYLFPATYEYTKDSTVESLAEEMVAAMNTALIPFYEQIKTKNLTVNEVLSLAALVEKEGANDEDRRNIAQVFYNRLTLGMPLQSNIAILYAEGRAGQKTTLKEDATIDTNIDSPYNLYIHTGFGPGPVANPGLAAIKATINPKDNNYLYFVADVTTGKVYYSETLEEHEKYVKQYVNDQVQ
ncbi:endolytic transglycosylase MltG [Streptococcaceae bacterium ESL0687]|nr:endolytic transglycosylase MltG [Streptococcaceae bacterium ESL0687]